MPGIQATYPSAHVEEAHQNLVEDDLVEHLDCRLLRQGFGEAPGVGAASPVRVVQSAASVFLSRPRVSIPRLRVSIPGRFRLSSGFTRAPLP
jgi:hypothetical protein